MVFSIKQYSQLPILKLRLNRDGRNDYNKSADLLETALITFAMKDEKTGIYQVANKAGAVLLKNPCDINSNKEYYISYTFTSEDTERPGIYIGEFKITFLDPSLQFSSELIVPIEDILYINVIDSFIKSDVVYIP